MNAFFINVVEYIWIRDYGDTLKSVNQEVDEEEERLYEKLYKELKEINPSFPHSSWSWPIYRTLSE